MRQSGVPNWPSAAPTTNLRRGTDGRIENDPNLTDKKFPGNPTLSYRSRGPLRVIAEVTKWQGHPPERLQEMRNGLARLKAEGADIIIDEHDRGTAACFFLSMKPSFYLWFRELPQLEPIQRRPSLLQSPKEVAAFHDFVPKADGQLPAPFLSQRILSGIDD